MKEGLAEINPYDRCVANKVIDGKQCTIVWYVDDNKVSHKDKKVVTRVIDLMKYHFGDLTVSRGNKYRFLGMSIAVNEEKNLEIEMKNQLLNVIDIFACAKGQDIEETVTSVTQKNLRDMNPDFKPLSSEKKENCHSIVATLLWIMKRTKPDLETAVGFLCIRVSKSNKDD